MDPTLSDLATGFNKENSDQSQPPGACAALQFDQPAGQIQLSSFDGRTLYRFDAGGAAAVGGVVYAGEVCRAGEHLV